MFIFSLASDDDYTVFLVSSSKGVEIENNINTSTP